MPAVIDGPLELQPAAKFRERRDRIVERAQCAVAIVLRREDLALHAAGQRQAVRRLREFRDRDRLLVKQQRIIDPSGAEEGLGGGRQDQEPRDAVFRIAHERNVLLVPCKRSVRDRHAASPRSRAR